VSEPGNQVILFDFCLVRLSEAILGRRGLHADFSARKPAIKEEKNTKTIQTPQNRPLKYGELKEKNLSKGSQDECPNKTLNILEGLYFLGQGDYRTPSSYINPYVVFIWLYKVWAISMPLNILCVILFPLLRMRLSIAQATAPSVPVLIGIHSSAFSPAILQSGSKNDNFYAPFRLHSLLSLL
jgi:hypothetical protein